MSTEYDRNRTGSLTEDPADTDNIDHTDNTHGHSGAASGYAPGEHEVIDAEVIDAETRDIETGRKSSSVDDDGQAFVAGSGSNADDAETGRLAADDGYGTDGGVGTHERSAATSEADFPETDRATSEAGTAHTADTERDLIATDEPEPGVDSVEESAESEPVVRQQSPAHDDETVVPLFDEQSLEQLRGRWRDLQGTFVDDPRDAVARADELVTELIHELTSTYAERKEIIADRWSDEPDTESLRHALRSYRAFFNQLLSPTS
ncbi:hypothetical protein [Nocardia aurea]|uniref:Uncharacterized protein n=1 Tax=Nocardia aurea TaxID=2144174 RepID=A0ABV3FUS2_9NOCA